MPCEGGTEVMSLRDLRFADEQGQAALGSNELAGSRENRVEVLDRAESDQR